MDISRASPKDCSWSCFDFDRTTRLLDEGTRSFTHMALFSRQESRVSRVTAFQDKATDRSFEFLDVIHRFRWGILWYAVQKLVLPKVAHKSEKFLRWKKWKATFSLILFSNFFDLSSQRDERSILKLHSYSVSWRCSSSSYRNCHRSSIYYGTAPWTNPRFLPRHGVLCDVNPTGTKRMEYRRPFSSRRKLPSSHHSWRAPPSIMYPWGQVSARPSGWLPVRIYLAFSSATSFLSVIYICMLVCISLQNLFPREKLAFMIFLCE